MINKLGVLPVIFDYDAGDGIVEDGVGAGNQLEVDTAVGLGVGGGEVPARVDDYQLGAAGLHPFLEEDGLGLVEGDAGDVDNLGVLPVLVGGAECVYSGVAEARGV